MPAYLLDTNAFAMAITGDQRLPAKAMQQMQQAERLCISVISFYEIGQKVRLGKWSEMEPHLSNLEPQARQDGFELIPLTAQAAMTAATLNWTHRDPFDRMIAAVAREERLPLLSSDKAFDDLGVKRFW